MQFSARISNSPRSVVSLRKLFSLGGGDGGLTSAVGGGAISFSLSLGRRVFCRKWRLRNANARKLVWSLMMSGMAESFIAGKASGDGRSAQNRCAGSFSKSRRRNAYLLSTRLPSRLGSRFLAALRSAHRVISSPCTSSTHLLYT